MGKIIELAHSNESESVIARKGANYKPDLRIYTAGIEADPSHTNLVHMIGSSTIEDLQGDTMSLLALNSMTKADPNMTIWLNHDYSLPDSIFGSVTSTPTIIHQDGIADLHLSVDVEQDNPAAAKVKKYIDNGRKLGCSIGCMVTKYEVPTEDDGENWYMQGITIHEVYVVEYSVVGIPCNQRSWVENAIRGVFTRTLDPHLAPAMKSLWPSRYAEIVRSLDAEQHDALYDQVPERARPDVRIEWNALNKSFTFYEGTQKKDMAVDTMKAWLRRNATGEDDMNKGKRPVIAPAPQVAAVPVAVIPENTKEVAPEVAKSLANEDEVPTQEGDPIAVEEEVSAEEVHVEEAPPVKEEVPEATEEEKVEEESVPIEEETVVTELQRATDPGTLALLSAYNTLGKQLALPEVTEHHYKTASHPAFTTKDVPTMHPTHLVKCMAIHSLVHDMTSGACCDDDDSGKAFAQAEQSADEASGRNPNGAQSVAYALGDSAALLMKSVERYNASLADVVDLKQEASLTRKELDAARTELLTLSAEIARAQETVMNLKDMPLGNPIGHTRTVHVEDNVAKREDFLDLNIQKSIDWRATDNLVAALALTELKTENSPLDGTYMRYRSWPEGVGGSVAKGCRPALQPEQITYMRFQDIRAYRDGKAAQVPYLGNQVANGHVRDTN